MDGDSGDDSLPEPHMKVYDDRVVVVDENGNEAEFKEGTQTEAARDRYGRIKDELSEGYLRELIAEVTDPEKERRSTIEPRYRNLIDEVVDAITSERGRAVTGLLCGQLTIKSIEPEQSIRLHKGSRSSAHFGWREGLSMRTIDSDYIAPALREFDLLRVNKDGVMMTRSLAENYPYSRFYNANIRGAQEEWGEIVDAVESSEPGPDPESLLRYLLGALYNRGERAEEIYTETIAQLEETLSDDPSEADVRWYIAAHVERSSHGARLLEIALHSLYQVLEDQSSLSGELKTLGQMRSANKKHGNIGDIEVLASGSEEEELSIREAWDAKYLKEEMDRELSELRDKLREHPESEVVGFVTFTDPIVSDSVSQKIESLEATFAPIRVEVVSFEEFVTDALGRTSQTNLANQWLRAYVETLCQRRRDRAPVDEPCQTWAAELQTILQSSPDA